MDIKLLAQVYDLAVVDKRLGDVYWSPIDIARINNWVLRAAAIKGEYHWHSHQDDELFLVYKGDIERGRLKGAGLCDSAI